MKNLTLGSSPDSPLSLLCLGAHPDDIEIGCGGAILKLIDTYVNADIYWVVFSSDGVRGDEARQSAEEFLSRAKSKRIVLKSFKTSFFPSFAQDIKQYFEQLKTECHPDLILTHYRHDLHQDHRVLSDLTWNSFRDHWILEYEIPKYDGDLGSPNVFVHLDRGKVEAKIDGILKNFRSQQDKQWFDRETFLAIMRLRGVESNAPEKYAEGFYCRKTILA